MTRVEHLSDDVTLYLGDCREILLTLGKVDAVITDPPYGLDFKYGQYIDTPDNLEELIAGFMPHLPALASRIIITPGVTNMHRYPVPKWTGAWTWETTSTFGALGFNQWQPILFYGDDVAGFASVNGVLKTDRLHFAGGGIVPAHGDLAKAHCCPKPPGVMTRMVARFTMPGETVLDPFAGSGTTGVACVQLGRKFIGIELEPRYFDIACRRISDELRRPRLQLEPVAKPVQEVMSL